MNWDDTGFLLSKNKYNENSLIAEIYTKKQARYQVLYLVEHQKKSKITYKQEINYLLVITANLKIELDILKLKYLRHFHQYILIYPKN